MSETTPGESADVSAAGVAALVAAPVSADSTATAQSADASADAAASGAASDPAAPAADAASPLPSAAVSEGLNGSAVGSLVAEAGLVATFDAAELPSLQLILTKQLVSFAVSLGHDVDDVFDDAAKRAQAVLALL